MTPSGPNGRRLATCLAVIAALAATVVVFATGPAQTPPAGRPGLLAPATALTGDITKTCGPGINFCWTCKTAVALGTVTITVDSTTDAVEPVKLAAGCTGSIDSLVVVTNSADGVKAAEGAHDLTIGGGTVTCTGRWNDVVHQDGIQVMGGDRITFQHMIVACPSTTPAPGDLEHSQFFISEAGLSTHPPTAIVFEDGYLASSAATVDIATSAQSGVRNSTVCPSVTVRDAVYVPVDPHGGPSAVDPIDEGNTKPASC